MNGATEATLAELLREAQNTNVNLERLNSLLSSSGNSGGNNILSPIINSAPVVGRSFGLLNAVTNVVTGTFNILSNILGQVVGGIGNTVKNLFNFSVSTALGTAKLSEFYAAFKDLPFGIGLVASIFSKIVGYSEELLETYRKLTIAGASFSGDLYAMRDAAARSNLSMQEFAGVIVRNSELFASMGGNVQTGINQFVAIQNRLMGPNSPYARQLLALGYNNEQAAEAIASYMRGQGTMNKQELMNIDKVSKGVISYVTELDTLSKLTGKQREKIEEELKAVELEETYQRFLSQLSPAEAEKIKFAVANMLQTGGKEAAEQLKLAFRGINTPITKGQQDLTAATQGLNLAVNDIIVQAVRQGKSGEEVGKIVRQQALRIGKQQFDFAAQLGESTVAALLASGATIVSAGNDFSSFYRKILAESKLPEAERKIIEQRLKQEEGNAAALGIAQNNIKNFGNQLLLIANSFIAPLAGNLISLGSSITGFITKLVGSKGFQEAVTNITNWFVDTYTMLKISWYEGWDSFWAAAVFQAKDAFKGIMEAVTPLWENHVKPALINGWNNLIQWMKPQFAELLKYIAQTLPTLIRGGYEAVTGESADESLSGVKGAAAGAATLGTAGALIGSIIPFIGTAIGGAIGAALGGVAGSLGLIDYGLVPNAPVVSTPTPKRHSGTLAMTGYGVEKKNQLVEIQPNEAVLTSTQVDQFGRSLALGVELNNNLTSEMKTLNKQTAELIKFMKETAEYTRRNLDAIKDLNGNLFA